MLCLYIYLTNSPLTSISAHTTFSDILLCCDIRYFTTLLNNWNSHIQILHHKEDFRNPYLRMSFGRWWHCQNIHWPICKYDHQGIAFLIDTLSTHIDITNHDNMSRSEFKRLRLSRHRSLCWCSLMLPIEKDSSERVCAYCTTNICEDEYHFVTKCPLYDDYRSTMLASYFHTLMIMMKTSNVYGQRLNVNVLS